MRAKVWDLLRWGVRIVCGVCLQTSWATEDAAFVGEPLSMNFQNIEVRTALQILADFTGLNVVAADSVTGSLSLRLQEVPWDQVLDIIAQAKGLSVRRSGNVIWVAPRMEV
ncbi:MAG: secretin and TonB N-terminal domain-containing protein, partial [Limnohabitans sp.]